jgi:altronate dehydratase small subunit
LKIITGFTQQEISEKVQKSLSRERLVVFQSSQQEAEMEGKIKVIVINEKDNVATALKPLNAGTKVSVGVQGCVEKIKLLSEIPMGHKFALKDIEEGEAVIKYGETIGKSTAKITRGEHVHVHNVISQPR